MTEVQKETATAEHANDESRSTLSIFAKVGYGFGHFANDLFATVWFSYTLLFLKDVLLMPNEAGYYMMLGQIADAFFTAIVGYLTDHYSTKRNWHIIGTVIVCLSFPVLFILRQDVIPYWGNLFYFSMFIVLFQCGWPIVQISHLAILPELSTTQADRSELNSVRYCMSIISNITVFVVAWLVLHTQGRSANRIGIEDFGKFRNIAIFLTAVGVLTTILFQVSLSSSNYNEKRQEKLKLKQTEAVDSSTKSLNLKVLQVLKNPDLYKIAFLYAFSRLFFVICIIYIPIWLNEFMKTKNVLTIENIALIPLAFFISSFFAAFLLKYVKNVSHKITYSAGSLISMLGCVWMTFSSNLETVELFGIAIALGAGSSITQISSLCITAELIGDNSENGGLIYSIITVCDKLFSGIIIFVIEALESSNNYYTDVLIFNGISALLGLVVLGTFKPKYSKTVL